MTEQDTASSQTNEHVGFALHKMRETADVEVVNMMHTAKVLSSAMLTNGICMVTLKLTV